MLTTVPFVTKKKELTNLLQIVTVQPVNSNSTKPVMIVDTDVISALTTKITVTDVLITDLKNHIVIAHQVISIKVFQNVKSVITDVKLVTLMMLTHMSLTNITPDIVTLAQMNLTDTDYTTVNVPTDIIPTMSTKTQSVNLVTIPVTLVSIPQITVLSVPTE